MRSNRQGNWAFRSACDQIGHQVPPVLIALLHQCFAGELGSQLDRLPVVSPPSGSRRFGTCRSGPSARSPWVG